MTGPDDVRAACGYPARPAALTVRCPICCAAEKQACTEQATGKRMEPHPSRVAEAEQPRADVIPIRRRTP